MMISAHFAVADAIGQAGRLCRCVARSPGTARHKGETMEPGHCVAPQSLPPPRDAEHVAPRTPGKRTPARLFYLTAGERKASMIFEALEARYLSPTVAYEHDAKSFIFRIANATHVWTEAFELPRVPRYLKLIHQWWNVAAFFRRAGRASHFDLCICEGIQFNLMMPYLRRLEVCRRFVYYSQDWFPSAPFLQRLDRFCVKHTDETWDICERTGEGRRAHWSEAPVTRTQPPLFQPVASLHKRLDDAALRCIYVGGLRSDVGLDLIIKAMGMASREGMRVHLDILGRDVDKGVREKLAGLAREEGVAGDVDFLGFVDTQAMVNLLARASCGLAVFTGGLKNYSNWAIIGKVREYIENGVPVIISRDNPMADELTRSGAGFAVGDSADEILGALRLLSKQGAAAAYCQNAHRLAQQKASPAQLYDSIDRALGR